MTAPSPPISDQDDHVLIGTANGLYRLQPTEAGKWSRRMILRTEKPVIQSVEDVDGSLFSLTADGALYRYAYGKTQIP